MRLADSWRGRRVFLTGHTGFKGSWLTAWLMHAGAHVTGYALAPPTSPSLFEDAKLADEIESIEGDVRDLESLRKAIANASPDVVIHMAAQSLVRPSYDDPVGTYATNVMGTVHVLEASRTVASIGAIVVVTSDKCYENREWVWPYRENDPLGGRDPYSSSKGAAEIVTAAYRRSFYENGAKVISVRAGNVIGGGDWAADRLVPDLIRAFCEKRSALIRNPASTRPWQFVLDPLAGYLAAAERALSGEALPAEWNFGPSADDTRSVRWVADRIAAVWGDGARWHTEKSQQPHEAKLLTLDSSRARTILGWTSAVDAATAVEWTADWYKAWLHDRGRARTLMTQQIERFEARP